MCGFFGIFGKKKNVKKEAILQKYGLEKGVIALSPHHLEEICHYNGIWKALGTEAYNAFFAMRELSLKEQGYTAEYIKNYGAIIEAFHASPRLNIAVVPGYDSMCAHCDKERAWCGSDFFIGADEEIASKHNLKEGRYSTEEIKGIFANPTHSSSHHIS